MRHSFLAASLAGSPTSLIAVVAFAAFAASSTVACGGSTVADGTTAGTDDTGTGVDDTSGGGGDAATDSGPAGDTASGSDTKSGGDASTDSGSTTVDTGTSSGDGGLSCGTATCGAGQVCCVTGGDGGFSQTCMASCPDGGVPLTCDGPDSCTPGAKFCCAQVDVGAGTPPTCPLSSSGASCKAVCPTEIVFSCPGKDQVKLCKKGADCADDAANPNCCTFSGGGGTLTFCASDAIKGFSSACH